MELGLEAGLSIQEFWELTPREVFLSLRMRNKRVKEHYEEMLWLAWHITMLDRQKRIPSLKQLLTNRGARVLKGEELDKRRQEFKEMSEAWHNRPH